MFLEALKVALSHLFFIIYLFIVGSCVGSFLNVVVYRVPRGQSLIHPPSRCPNCEHRLAWFDNIPVFGWLMLGGKCRYCKNPISPRYPIVEAITGLLFAFFYFAIFVWHQGPFIATYSEQFDIAIVTRMTDIKNDWPIFGLYLFAVAALFAAALIDAELFIIPQGISLLIIAVAVLVHTFVDRPQLVGAIGVDGASLAFTAGALPGLIASILLLRFGVLPMSFAEGEPPLEVEKLKKKKEENEELPDFTPAQIRREIVKEILFLAPPVVLGSVMLLLQMHVPSVRNAMANTAQIDWLGGLSGAFFGGLIGGGFIWAIRVVFSLAFGKEAMGLGDVDLMFAVGAVMGAGPASISVFVATFLALPITLTMFFVRARRQLPFGPYLSMASALLMLFYFPIYDHYVRQIAEGLGNLLHIMF
jgi:leader peptidase (prepilin peptidase)/N-methyltransferase